jgi:hypothetical protein
MNLKQDPSIEQLKNLIASQDDEIGHHMIWVSFDGDVFVDVIPRELTPVGYVESLDGRVQFRLETLQAGNGYVGPSAAENQAWIGQVYAALVTNYENGSRGYIDWF